MKLDEVVNAQVKCALIIPAGGNQSLDAGDWHGSTEVYTSKSAFVKALKEHFAEWHRSNNDEDDDNVQAILNQIRRAKSINELEDVEDWGNFVEMFWIDDRF